MAERIIQDQLVLFYNQTWSIKKKINLQIKTNVNNAKYFKVVLMVLLSAFKYINTHRYCSTW